MKSSMYRASAKLSLYLNYNIFDNLEKIWVGRGKIITFLITKIEPTLKKFTEKYEIIK